MAALYMNSGGARALPLNLLLSTLPSLPRPMLARLVTAAIDQMDELDGDADLEDDDPAGDPCDWGEKEEGF